IISAKTGKGADGSVIGERGYRSHVGPGIGSSGELLDPARRYFGVAVEQNHVVSTTEFQHAAIAGPDESEIRFIAQDGDTAIGEQRSGQRLREYSFRAAIIENDDTDIRRTVLQDAFDAERRLGKCIVH